MPSTNAPLSPPSAILAPASKPTLPPLNVKIPDLDMEQISADIAIANYEGEKVQDNSFKPKFMTQAQIFFLPEEEQFVAKKNIIPDCIQYGADLMERVSANAFDDLSSLNYKSLDVSEATRQLGYLINWIVGLRFQKIDIEKTKYVFLLHGTLTPAEIVKRLGLQHTDFGIPQEIEKKFYEMYFLLEIHGIGADGIAQTNNIVFGEEHGRLTFLGSRGNPNGRITFQKGVGVIPLVNGKSLNAVNPNSDDRRGK